MRTILILAAICVTSAAPAAELRIPLPDLIGIYELSTFENQTPTDPPSQRTTYIQTGIAVSDFRGLQVELTGSVLSGAAVGDGVFRQPVATPLRGSFAPSFLLGNFGLSWLFVAEEVDGPYSRVCEFPGSFDYPFAPPVVNFDPLMTLSLSPSTFSFTNINYIEVPSEPIVLPDVRGIDITNPMRGEITSAYLVVQFVPEPTSFVLLCIGTAVLGTRGRREQKRCQEVRNLFLCEKGTIRRGWCPAHFDPPTIRNGWCPSRR